MSSANWPELAPEPDAQLKAYELGLKETDQIIAIQNHTATVATTLLVVTGAIWAALHAKEVRIPDSAAVAILALHILACLPALQLLVSNTNAIIYGSPFTSTTAGSGFQTSRPWEAKRSAMCTNRPTR